jgi:hypothetical protein
MSRIFVSCYFVDCVIFDRSLFTSIRGSCIMHSPWSRLSIAMCRIDGLLGSDGGGGLRGSMLSLLLGKLFLFLQALDDRKLTSGALGDFGCRDEKTRQTISGRCDKIYHTIHRILTKSTKADRTEFILDFRRLSTDGLLMLFQRDRWLLLDWKRGLWLQRQRGLLGVP